MKINTFIQSIRYVSFYLTNLENKSVAHTLRFSIQNHMDKQNCSIALQIMTLESFKIWMEFEM